MRVLTCEMNSEEKKEFCQKHNIDPLLLQDNCPCPKDENGIAIFPEKKSDTELIYQLQDHISKMTEQLNNITMSLKK